MPALRSPYWAVLEASALQGPTAVLLEAVRAMVGQAPRVADPAARAHAWEALLQGFVATHPEGREWKATMEFVKPLPKDDFIWNVY